MEPAPGQQLELEDFWNEVKLIQEMGPNNVTIHHTNPSTDDHNQHSSSQGEEAEEEEEEEGDECAEEREWLASLGLDELLGEGYITEPHLSRTLQARSLSHDQAAAVRRRVHNINNTLTSHLNQRHHNHRHHHRHRTNNKPHVRHLFHNPQVDEVGVEARSRSATPDSLDSDDAASNSITNNDSPLSLSSLPPINLVSSCNNQQPCGRASAPQGRRQVGTGTGTAAGVSHEALFRRATRSILASETADGITMVGYQRIGSLRVRERSTSETQPLSLNLDHQPHTKHQGVCLTRSAELAGVDGNEELAKERQVNKYPSSGQLSSDVGFQKMWADTPPAPVLHNNFNNTDEEEGACGRTRVDYLADQDVDMLRPLLFLELTSIMDKSGIRIGKLKPNKTKIRKQDGILFGVSLGGLLEKDQQITMEPHCVPLVFQKVMGEVERRGLREEGVLRIAGNAQRVEALCSEVERHFWRRPELADHLLASATVHELTTLLKRLIRALPHPLLTSELIHLFYRAHGCCDWVGALNMLVLLLPKEHRGTLLRVLTFLSNVVSQQAFNKMSAHNVATIIAPSLFPPNIVVGKSNLKAELGVAVECCRLTEVMISAGSKLWLVPHRLIQQLRNINHNKNNNNITKPPTNENMTHIRRSDNNSSLATLLIQIEAPQFLAERTCMIPVDKQASVGDIVLRIVEMGREAGRRSRRGGKHEEEGGGWSGGGGNKLRLALSELAPNGNLSCLLSTGDPDTALATHFLYEIGGNIGQRRLEVDAILGAVYKHNPHAQFVLRCDHRNGSHRILKRM